MAQLSDDCFAFGGDLMTTEAALAELNKRISPVADTERVALSEALDRILAEDLKSARDVPPHDNSAVDGYAIYFDDLDAESPSVLPVRGRAAAGHPLKGRAKRGAAIRIFTGAPMPDGENGGPDTVMMQEDCKTLDGPDGKPLIEIALGIARGANRRTAGEDVKSGSVILKAGRRLRPQDLGLAASVGCTELAVQAPLKVAIFSTGDEIRDPGQDAPPGCVYDANRVTIAGLLKQLGCAVTDLGIQPDELGAITKTLSDAAMEHALIVTSGGMSVGEEDHVRDAVEKLGSIHFWRLAIKPGRPIALGQVKRVPFVGLPGNPVAVMVTFLRFVRPMVLLLSGCTEIEPRLYSVRAGFSHRKKKDRREWVRARLLTGPDGAPVAEKFSRQGAGILSSMVAADGLVELPEAMTQLDAGTMVDFLPFNEVR
ncbi:MAG: molybdopterin molybdotransferase MoeA [Alphaproteobacteria bacterium]|nr:molybdopterin molybdotransferase MoeA [Alphaproteobacteria bacterium]